MTPREVALLLFAILGGAAGSITVQGAIVGEWRLAGPAAVAAAVLLTGVAVTMPTRPPGGQGREVYPRRWRWWHRRGPWRWTATLAPLGVPTVDATPRVLDPDGTWRLRAPGPAPLFRSSGTGHDAARLVGRVEWVTQDGTRLRAGGSVHDRRTAARMFARRRRLYPAPFLGALGGGAVPFDNADGAMTLPCGEVLAVYLTALPSWPGRTGFEPDG